MSSDANVLMQAADGIATIRLNRPRVHNALSRAMVKQLADATHVLDLDGTVSVVIVVGEGKSFCAGLDTKEALPVGFPELLRDGLGDREALFRLRKPTIAAVTGAAFGAGLELALMCDLILCDETARFSLPEVTRNGMPGAGGTQRLARLIGRMRATELCLTGRAVLPGEAARLGLVLEIVAEGRALEAAQRLAKQIAAAPTTNTMLIKQSCRSTDEIGLSAGLVLERTSSDACIANRQASQRE